MCMYVNIYVCIYIKTHKYTSIYSTNCGTVSKKCH